MANKRYYHNLDLLQASKLVQAAFEMLAADPTSPVEAQEWYNSTENVRKTVANSTVEIYAFRSWVLEQINALGRAQGTFDSNPGTLPVLTDKSTGDLTAFQAGDAWIISNGGTIAGILGDDNLSVGDKLQYVSGDPTNPANWVGIQTNLDDSAIGNIEEEVQTISLVAGTAFELTAVNIASIRSLMVLDSTGAEIGVCIERTGPNAYDITSNVSLTGVDILMVGTRA